MKAVHLLLCAVMLALSACSLTQPRDVGNANMLALSAPEIGHALRQRQGGIKVGYPTAPAELDTYRIAVSRADGRQDYFSGARWSDFLPLLVQGALMEALSKNNAFTSVASDESVKTTRYVLTTEIQECRAVYSGQGTPPVIVMRMALSIANANGKHMLKKFVLEKRVEAANNTLASIAAAFNEAFSAIANDMLDKLQPVN